MTTLFKPLRELAKSFAFKYTRLGAPRYPYNIEPIQLATLIYELERLKNVAGNILEIGVARGMTTKFICQHITAQKIEKNLKFFAVDTFSSFTKEDLDYEVHTRGKSLFELKGFAYIDFKVWVKNFKNYPFLEAIKSDCSVVDYSKLGPIKLTFLDVDLYLPTKKALPKIFDATVNGGIILVDDVLNGNTYDGAYQAYMEFCASKNIEPKVIGNRCGIIYKSI
jgi:O-methyltransferase